MKTPTIKQILLITDGCSNKGEDPSVVAINAFGKGITVNVIGVLEQDKMNAKGMKEIEDISSAGGGIHQVVYSAQLSQTVQMVTRQAMTQTIQGVVNKQLQQIFGQDYSIDELPPERRGEVMEVVEDIGETAKMDLLVLIDTSASMAHKLPTVKEAIFDLSISLNARTGSNRYSVFVFPGANQDVERVLDWTPKLESLTKVFAKLKTGGYTPTGPALREAIAQFESKSTSTSNYESLLDYRDDYYEETI